MVVDHPVFLPARRLFEPAVLGALIRPTVLAIVTGPGRGDALLGFQALLRSRTLGRPLGGAFRLGPLALLLDRLLALLLFTAALARTAGTIVA